jgi:hypothetical protein
MYTLPINPILFSFIIVWTLIWKGWGMWESARRGQKVWFVIILATSSLGILEMIYLFFVSKAHEEHMNPETKAENTSASE